MPKKASSDTDFEESRRCLLNVYHSYVQNHAGFAIAVIIGAFTLLSSWNSFFGTNKTALSPYIFFSLISALGSAGFYVLIRTMYWTNYAGCLTSILPEGTEKLYKMFCDRVKPKDEFIANGSLLLKLEWASKQHLWETKKKNP